MSDNSENHHYVPKFYLRNFTFNSGKSLVLCQSLIEGYSFLSLIRASSVVNRQWTVVPC